MKKYIKVLLTTSIMTVLPFTATAAEQADTLNIYISSDNGSGPIATQNETTILENLKYALDAAQSVRPSQYRDMSVTLINMSENRVVVSGSMGEVRKMPIEDITELTTPEKMCADIGDHVDYLVYRVEADEAENFVWIMNSPLLDFSSDLCDDERPGPFPQPPMAPKDSYGLERIMKHEKLKAAYFVGWHFAQEKPWDEALSSIGGKEPIFLKKGRDLVTTFSKMKAEEIDDETPSN